MNWTEYLEASKRTDLSPTLLNEAHAAGVTRCGGMNVIHHAIGLASEVFELLDGWYRFDPKHTQEEIGDCLWYMAGLWRECGFPEKEIDSATILLGSDAEARQRLLKCTGGITDIVKRSLFYGKDFDSVKLETLLRATYACLKFIATPDVAMDGKPNMKLAMEANIAKLKDRHPDGFSYQTANGHKDAVVHVEPVEGRAQ